MAFDTFDTDSVATAGITFSNGNLTALGITGSALLTSGIAQAREGKKSGKWYVEFTCNAVSGNIDGVGVLNSWGIQSSPSSRGYIGGTAGNGPSSDAGWSYLTQSSISNVSTGQTAVNNTTWTAGDVIGMAIDLDNSRLWWNKNGGSWVGTSGTPNPATNTNGFNISHLLSNGCRVYPGCSLGGASAKFTANFGASSFTGTVPSGFTSGWTNTTAGTYFGTFATTGFGSQTSATPVAGQAAVSGYAATLTGTITTIIIPFAGTTVSNVKAIIFDNTGTGGKPGALLGVSAATGNTAYGEASFDFTSQNISVTNGTTYYFGIIVNTNATGSTNVTLTPPETGGTYVSPSNNYTTPTSPFGTPASTVNFRYPIIINVNTITPEDAVGSSSGAGAASGVALTGLVSVGSAAGAGTASGVSFVLNSSVGSSTGAGAASAVSIVGVLAVGSAVGAGSASAVTNENIYSIGAASGVGSIFGTSTQTDYSGAMASGQARVRGVGIMLGRVLPFDIDRAWAIDINGPVIDAVQYDPITLVMRVIYAFPLTIDVGNLPYTITNTIANSNDPQDYVLGLVASASN